ncbi:f860a0a9-079d-4e1e-bbe1-43a05074760f [Sclerotinia trifoliorum]|uniref:F860a0a9-079d-4e1e-bbe1-43a05074760f n=1 Tax=Sclerotinia trifoliorum TaxID=28548 RepID=A0A8H2VXS8_9HELO|nr:f860a0a9-079d-4e1e-bbe1-43a05074760f [Sclerotinia trifoliorum]
MDSTGNASSNNKRLSLRRSIVGSIKRSLSPLSRKSDSPTTSQTSGCSVESAQDSLFLYSGRSLPGSISSKSGRFKKSNCVSPNDHVVTEYAESSSSRKCQLTPSHVSPATNRIPKPNSFSPQNRVSVQSMQDIPSPKKKLPTRAASTASKLRKSLSTSFRTDDKNPIQALKDAPAQESNWSPPTQTAYVAGARLPKKFPTSSTTSNSRSSIHSIKKIPSSEKDLLPLVPTSFTTSRRSIGIKASPMMNQTTPKSEHSTPHTTAKRSSIVSFQIPEDAQIDSPQNDMLFNIHPPSSASKSSRSSWLSTVSRTSSTKIRNQPQSARLQRLALGGGRETSRSQRQHVSTSAKETTLPWDSPFDRNWDLMADDGVPVDFNDLFKHCLPPRQNNNFSLFFHLPVNVRRRVYSYCLPDRNGITILLSPHFVIKNCYHGYYFSSPWNVLECVAGGLASFSLMRNDLMTYFWTEYQFHVTLSPFCNSVFTPLSSVWLPNFLDRIQHLTIEIDLTRFGGNALKFARRFGYNMEKMESLLLAVVNGLIKREGKMAELTLLCRRFDGHRPIDENDPDWKADDFFEYFPKEAMQFCDAVINLRGIVKSVRIAGFPLDYTKTLLNSLFGQEGSMRQFVIPDRSAWPPLPQLYAGIKHASNFYAPSMTPTSSEFLDHQESLNTPWLHEVSVCSIDCPEDHDESLTRPDTSLSVTTVGDQVNLYQDLSPSTISPNSSPDSVNPLSDPTRTPARNATVTYQVMAAEDRNNSKRHTNKLNPRNSSDLTPGHFCCQPGDGTQVDLMSRREQQVSDPDMINLTQQVLKSTWTSQGVNRTETHPSGENSDDHWTFDTVNGGPLLRTSNPQSKRKSQFGEWQMPDIPESPLNTTSVHDHIPISAIRPGTLKASNDLHIRRIHAHIEKSTSESDEGASKPPSLYTSLTSKQEGCENSNEGSLILTPSRNSISEVSKYCNDYSSPRPSSHVANHDIQQLDPENPIDRRLLRTPSPPARLVLATSPNTLNSINERDPKYILSIRALRSASTSTESVIRAPTKVLRPTSLAHPTTWPGVSMGSTTSSQRSLTSTASQAHRAETNQSVRSGELDWKKSRFMSLFRRSG